MKIVVNKCWGGFSISTKAIKELVLRNAKCIKSFTPEEYYGKKYENKLKDDLEDDYKDIGDGYLGHKYGFNIYKDEILYDLNDGDNSRADKDLIEVVKQLGEEANGQNAKLVIIEIPDDVDWEIDEYDGMESIHEKHRSW